MHAICHIVHSYKMAEHPLATAPSSRTTCHPDQVCNLVTALVALPFPLQDQALIQRSSLQVRMAHFAHAIPWNVLSAPLARVEAQLRAAVFTLIQRPCEAAGPIAAQIALPLQLGGLGFRHLTAIEAHAALLSALALTHTTMRHGPEAFRPFSPVVHPAYAPLWHTVYDATFDSFLAAGHARGEIY
jgi:hypothetical protein